MNSNQSTTQENNNTKDTANNAGPSSEKVFISVDELAQMQKNAQKNEKTASDNTAGAQTKTSEGTDIEALFVRTSTQCAEETGTDRTSSLFDDIDSEEYSDTGDTGDTDTASAPDIAAAKNKRRRWPWITAGCVLFVILCYLLVIFIPTGPIANLRDIYIQTAMSTADHQWLATIPFPDWVIERAWTDPNVKPPDAPDDSHLLETAGTDTEVTTAATEPVTDVTTEPAVTETETETAEPAQPTEPDILGLATLKVGDTDYAGNKVIVADEEEGLFISEFTLTSHMMAPAKYHGYAMLIDDPSRVFVGSTPKPYVLGYRLGEMMDYYGDIIGGINASGFSDPNDAGTGGDIIGACFSEGKFWGQYTNTMASVVLTDDDKLVVGWLQDWSKYTNIRDGMQFGPVLVDKGKNLIDEASGGGWGFHPRSAIGQREDGAIIMIVIDGRVESSRLGCTIWEMAEMMVKYGAQTAGGCDGGSSVVLGYDGEILNDNSSANPEYGRKMPNAFLVRSKKKDS